MSPAPDAPRVKAIRVPSGDHAGVLSLLVPSLSCVVPPPSAVVTKIWYWPDELRSLAYAIRVPSGDQAAPASTAPLFDRLIGFVPSWSMTYTSELPSRPLWKAMRPFWAAASWNGHAAPSWSATWSSG